MNGFLLLVPFLLIRFGILSIFNDNNAIQRAAHFPPMVGKERLVYWIYQILNIMIFVYLYFLTVKIDFSWLFYSGLVIYILGLILCTISIVNYGKPTDDGLNINGIYRISRHPMYLSYFVCFIGCAILTRSLVLGGIVIIFQFASHYIILYEERWCIERFGDEYKRYMNEVRRYI